MANLYPVLTPDLEAAATAIANGATWGEAAQAMGVSRTTLLNRAQENPAVRELIRSLRSETQEKLLSDLEALAPLAVTVYRQALEGEKVTVQAVEVANRLFYRIFGRPATTGGVAVEAIQPDGSTVRIVVGYPPGAEPGR